MWIYLLGILPILGSIPVVANLYLQKMKKKTEELTAPALGKATLITASAKELEAAKSYTGEDYAKRFQYSMILLEERAEQNSDFNIYGYIYALIQKLRELNSSVSENGVTQTALLAYTKYDQPIRRIIDLTSDKFYGDFLRNPDHWEEPQKMRIMVEKAVLKVAQEVQKDIKLHNHSKTLDFKLSAGAILGDEVSELAASTDSRLSELFNNPNESSNDELSKLYRSLESESTVKAKALEVENNQREQESVTKDSDSLEITGGSKRNLKFQNENFIDDFSEKKLIEKTIHRNQITAFKQPLDEEHSVYFLVKSVDLITGETLWTKFQNLYEAADFVDKEYAKIEKEHPWRHDCRYCKEQ